MTLSDGENEILAIEAKRAEVLVAADIATLDRITSDDYVHVESSGTVRTKAEFLLGLERGEYRFDSFVIDENRVRVFGDTAAVTGRYHNDIRTAAGPRPAKYARHIRIYVRDGDRWTNVAHQATETGPPREP